MSAQSHAHAPAHGGDHGHGHTAGHGSRRDYVTGFLLAGALTAAPFWLVMSRHGESPALIAVIVMGLAMVQVVVHMVYFLHMNRRAEGGWTLMALLFTILLLGIVLSGSLWVMHHLDVNMMPMSPQDMRQMP
ncbi:MAG TPA: cytochrome o ubiquinol oxidase subunit IV [Phenylobacterium sp.]|uniref:cytochrome o ubiquinol oxidase subunit IV n=1 Tax=Phenylobacterium sp. TaxID=1871053 RepID=UPI002B49C5D7|nr:cytochrome o ubiquinol oxidase subunit IV [Phenylobacterium sp.]HKR89858.1 cytochrome o ubiquinol oxidase subunit IV [Phenylobacterium sp.]